MLDFTLPTEYKNGANSSILIKGMLNRKYKDRFIKNWYLYSALYISLDKSF